MLFTKLYEDNVKEDNIITLFCFVLYIIEYRSRIMYIAADVSKQHKSSFLNDKPWNLKYNPLRNLKPYALSVSWVVYCCKDVHIVSKLHGKYGESKQFITTSSFFLGYTFHFDACWYMRHLARYAIIFI